MTTQAIPIKNNSSLISLKPGQDDSIKADLFTSTDHTILTNSNSLSSSDLPNYQSQKHNNYNKANNNSNLISEKESVNKNKNNHSTSYISSPLQGKKWPISSNIRTASHSIKINCQEKLKECKVKQLDLRLRNPEKVQSKPLMNEKSVSTGEQFHDKFQSTQNNQLNLCMSPRCPPDGAAFHEISPSTVSKSKKPVIYENLIDRYLLVGHENYLTKEFSNQPLVTPTVTSVNTSTVTNATGATNYYLNSNVKNCSTEKVPQLQEIQTLGLQTSSETMTVTPHNLSQDSHLVHTVIDKNNLTSSFPNHFPSASNQTINNTRRPLSPSNSGNWFPPPPPPPLQDSIADCTDLRSKAPHYHEHCRPDEVHPSLIKTVHNPTLSNNANLNASSATSKLNPITQIITSFSLNSSELSPSPPTPPLPPPSTPPGPPSVPPRHPATTLQYKTLPDGSPKVTSKQPEKNITTEQSDNRKLADTVGSSSAPTLSSSSKNTNLVDTLSIHDTMNQLDKNRISFTEPIQDHKSESPKSHSGLPESKLQVTISTNTSDENKTKSEKYPPDGRSVVPWDSNRENISIISSSLSPTKSCRTDETKMTETQPTTITSSSSLPDRNIIWAFSQLPITTYPLENLNVHQFDSLNSTVLAQQSENPTEPKGSQVNRKQNAEATRPNYLSQYMIVKSTETGHPSFKRLLSPDDLKKQHLIQKHHSSTNKSDLNNPLLLEDGRKEEFVHFAYPLNDSMVFSHHDKEFVINSQSDMHTNQPVDLSWLRAQQRAELIDASKSRNVVHRSCRDFSQHQFSAEPVFVNMRPDFMHVSPSLTHKEHTQHVTTSKHSPTTNSHKNSYILMTQSSLPAGFPEQQSDFYIHYKHKSDNLVHTNSKFLTSDSTQQQNYRQRNHSYNPNNSCTTESLAPSYNSSMTQSVFFPLDSGWGPPATKQSESTSGKHKKHRSNVIRSHSQRNPDSYFGVECNHFSLSSEQSRYAIPPKYYYNRSSSQTVPVNPGGNSVWPQVMVQWRERRPNGAASSENFSDMFDAQNIKGYSGNIHIPADCNRRQKSEDLQRHHYSTTAISEQLENQLWFHHDLPRAHAEKLLKTTPTGSFLVRRSETSKTELSLSIKRENDVLHMKISQDPETKAYVLGEYSQPYPSISAMIYRYSRTLLPVRGTTPVLLRFPVSRVAFSH